MAPFYRLVAWRTRKYWVRIKRKAGHAFGTAFMAVQATVHSAVTAGGENASDAILSDG